MLDFLISLINVFLSMFLVYTSSRICLSVKGTTGLYSTPPCTFYAYVRLLHLIMGASRIHSLRFSEHIVIMIPLHDRT